MSRRRKRHSPERIFGKLRDAEGILVAKVPQTLSARRQSLPHRWLMEQHTFPAG
jgi:hypothetical protein